MNDRFKIIFDRLEEAKLDVSLGHESIEGVVRESDEIAELRRIVLEVVEPEPSTFTTT